MGVTLRAEHLLRPSRFLGAQRDLPRRITWPTGLASAVGEGWAGLKPTTVGELDLALWVDRWVGGTDGRLTEKLLGGGDLRVHRVEIPIPIVIPRCGFFAAVAGGRAPPGPFGK